MSVRPFIVLSVVDEVTSEINRRVFFIDDILWAGELNYGSEIVSKDGGDRIRVTQSFDIVTTALSREQ